MCMFRLWIYLFLMPGVWNSVRVGQRQIGVAPKIL